MTEHSPAAGFTRRGVLKTAAWAAPVVAVAVAAPLASASVVFDSPTAFVTGTLTATGSAATTRSASYSGGALSYSSAGTPGVNSGNITLSLSNAKPAFVVDFDAVAAAYVAAGWVLVSKSNALIVFTHVPISDGGTISMPAVTWTAPVGTSKPAVAIDVESDSDDVSGLGLRTS